MLRWAQGARESGSVTESEIQHENKCREEMRERQAETFKRTHIIQRSSEWWNLHKWKNHFRDCVWRLSACALNSMKLNRFDLYHKASVNSLTKYNQTHISWVSLTLHKDWKCGNSSECLSSSRLNEATVKNTVSWLLLLVHFQPTAKLTWVLWVYFTFCIFCFVPFCQVQNTIS